MSKYTTQTPYIASYVIIRQEGKIAFLLRHNTKWMNGYYGLPSGKVEKNESALKAASRETGEEVGVEVAAADLKFVHLMHRHAETDWIDVFYEVQNYSGKAANAEPDIHSQLSWFNPKDLPPNVLDYIASALNHIENGVYYSQFDWD